MSVVHVIPKQKKDGFYLYFWTNARWHINKNGCDLCYEIQTDLLTETCSALWSIRKSRNTRTCVLFSTFFKTQITVDNTKRNKYNSESVLVVSMQNESVCKWRDAKMTLQSFFRCRNTLLVLF